VTTSPSPSGLPSILIEESESVVRLSLNIGLYTEDVIFRTCYSFSDSCSILVDRIDPEHVLVELRKHDESVSLKALVREFANDLVNQRVRSSIASETKLIRDLIVSQAFAEADLRPEPR
jgi:His-Xaa-Ser system protein HxsD